LGSISAYYYTPVRGMFAGALLAIGACLVCIRGSTTVEDILLNVAGMLAPVVALIPTPPDKKLPEAVGDDRLAAIANKLARADVGRGVRHRRRRRHRLGRLSEGEAAAVTLGVPGRRSSSSP